MTLRAYVDESYRRTYLLALTVIDAKHQNETRKALREMCLPGQYRLHMKNESDSRRRWLLATLNKLPITVHVIESEPPIKILRHERDACLKEAIRILADLSIDEVTIESCGQDHLDRQLLSREIKRISASVQFVHTSPVREPLLWSSDLFAWAYGKDVSWRRKVEGLVGSITRIES